MPLTDCFALPSSESKQGAVRCLPLLGLSSSPDSIWMSAY